MVSFISAFYHIYLLSSLFQPSTTLDITLFFIQQVQQKVSSQKAIILETKDNGTRPNNNSIQHRLTLALKNENGPRVILGTILHIAILLLRVFILLCILLVISLVEMAQLYYRQSMIQPKKTDIKQEALKLEDSPSLLPTPPSEKYDIDLIPVSLPTTTTTNHYAPIIKHSEGDTAVKPAPSEPTPPDTLKSKQQQTMLIVNNTITTTNANNVDDVEMHPSIEKQPLTSQPDHLQNDFITTTTKPAKEEKDDVKHHSDDDGETNTTTPPVEIPSSTAAETTTPPPPEEEQMISKDDEIVVVEPVVSEMPDHAPTPSPSSISTHDMTTTQDNEPTPPPPALPSLPAPPPPPPALSPSGSLSSSLSTLAYTHNSNHHHNQQQQQQEKPTKGPTHHHSASRLHHAYLEKQSPTPLPRPHSSYSTRSQQQQQQQQQQRAEPLPPPAPAPAPAPQGSSLSMKLNKLKKPGRRLSQLFKKKNTNKNKADQ